MDRFALVYKGVPPDLCVCDQALRPLPDGEWAVFFMTGGDTEPRKDNHIAVCRSKDRGRTWSRKETVLRYDDRACTLTEVLVQGREVRIWVNIHRGFFEEWRNYVITSRDAGRTWDAPAPFDPLPRRGFVRNFYAATWGESFLPFQSYDTVPDPAVSPLRDGSHKLARNGVLISGDEGRTPLSAPRRGAWTRSADTGPVAGWAENNVVELRDGRMVMFIREDHGRGCIMRSDSGDRGRTWSPPAPTDIPNPGSKFRLHRLRSGRIILIHNPNPRARNPLALWASDDDMKTWPHKRVLTDFPGALQYPDGFVDEDEGCVHFTFDYNRHDLIYVGAKLP